MNDNFIFKIKPSDFGKVIHDILQVIQILKNIETSCTLMSKSEDCKKQIELLHTCELKLLEIRQETLTSVEDETLEDN